MKLNWKALFLLTTCCTLGLMTTAKAQITPDNSLGAESSTLGQPNQAINGIPINQIDQINGGARRGGNLFHSFGEFNVNAGRGAYFSNPAGIANILTRVTGVNRSNILGTLGVLGNANLFLINPNGIFFGPNSSLDLGGSFFGSSANSLLFDNGIEFSATNPQAPPLLTVNIPIGLRFRDNPGNITNQSVVEDNNLFGIGLRVNPGNSLALVGGNVSLEQGGRLTAAGGRIELGGLAGAGTVGLQTTGNTFTLNFPTNGLSNVSLLDDARVAVRSNGGGEIAVNANIFTATNGGRLVGGIEGIATRNGGDITVNSNEFNISGVGQSGSGAQIAQQVVDGASGNAGNIFVNTKSFNASSGAQLQNTVLSTGTGNAGNISITSNSLSLTNAEIDVSVLSEPSGNAGNITINAGSIFTNNALLRARNEGNGSAGNISLQAGDAIALTNGSQISSSIFGTGDAGNIVINATDKVTITGEANSGITAILNTVGSEAAGNAGKIIINTGSLEGSGNFIIGSATFGQGNAGTVSITAKDKVSLDGLEGLGRGILSAVGESAMGDGADIIINARSLSLSNSAQLATSTLGQGRAGNIRVNTSESISVNSNSILQANSFIDGQNAGNIDLTATGGSIVLNQATISSSAQNTGFAGDIRLNARDQVSITNNSTVSSDGDLGRIFIGSTSNTTGAVVPNIINIDNSTLSTTNADPTGFAGDITLNARNQVSITNNSTVSSEGNLGSIFIGPLDTTNALSILPSRINIENSTLSTTNSNTDFAGDITLNARDEIFIKDSTISSNGNLGQIFIGDANSFLPALVKIEGANTRLSTQNNTAPNQNAGSINIAAGRVVMNLGELSSSTFGSGRAGDISVQATGAVEFDGNVLFSNVRSGAQNSHAGNITIKAGSFSLLNGAELQSRVMEGGQGDGGNVTVDVPDGIVKIVGANSQGNPSGIFNDVESGASGNAGNIFVNAASIFLDDRAELTTTNASAGFAGDIVLNARDQISLDRRSRIESNGNRGRIFIGKNDLYGDGISSPRVVSLDNASILSTRNGSVIEAPDRQINSGNISVDALDSIFLGNGSEIIAATDRRGNGGDVTIRSRNSVTFSGVAPTILQDGNPGGFSSGLFSSSDQENSGAGGQILVETPNLRILDGAVISARSRSAANAGNITVNSRNVELRGGGQILATAFSSGNAGNIDVTADNITISGADPTLNTRFNQVAQQFGRDTAEQVIDPVQPESGIFVNSSGTGQGGNLSITGNSLTLDRGIISASTQSADGGDITLNLRNFIRLRNESLISTNARGQQGGNGGNITINSPFIVAFPQNNDIIANAVSGSGGRVRTNATLFGIIPRTRADLERLGVPSLNPRNLSTSDITAFSEQNSNFGDNVLVTSPDVDPSRGLVELPETVSDRTQQIAQNPCQQGIGNEFVVTGRGGLPTTPNETLSSDNVRVDLLQPVASSGNSPSATIKPATTPTATRVPAQGWIFNEKGQVVLTAYDPTNTGSQRSFRTAAACPAR